MVQSSSGGVGKNHRGGASGVQDSPAKGPDDVNGILPGLVVEVHKVRHAHMKGGRFRFEPGRGHLILRCDHLGREWSL